MTIKEIHTRAGSISGYLWYIIVVFGWHFLYNRFTTIRMDLPDSSLAILGDWIFTLFLAPLLLAGVFGGIYAQQRSKEEWTLDTFIHAIKTHYWRILVANTISLSIFIIITIIVLIARGVDAADLEKNKLLSAILSTPRSAINLFWFAAIVVERKIFRALLRSLRTVLFNPIALVIGLLWGLISFADSNGIEFPTGELSLLMDVLRAAVLAIARTGAIMYALAVYSKAWEDARVFPEETPLTESPSSDEGLIQASLGFTFVSFVPLLHLITLFLGILALRRRKQFVMRALAACCVGGFFTLFYAILFIGWLASRAAPSTFPGYAFLTDVNPDLTSLVALLEQGSFEEVEQRIKPMMTMGLEHHWTLDSALALAKIQSNDLDGALEDFKIAVQKKPERSEFYYFYGMALLQKDQQEAAAIQFQNALDHGPRLAVAQRYLTLINTAYKPSRTASALLFVFILLILFTLHEYGHAYVAWKLGDDTAQKQGRLTLNPLPHLELFGSIILPAILLWQQSEIIFGWAKPVQITPENFKDPRKDHMTVSFAGPAINLLVSMVSLILLGGIMLFVRLFWPDSLSLNISRPFSSVSLVGPSFAGLLVILVVFLKQLFYTSLILGCFNLIPIPPLDGSWILSGMLPSKLRTLFEKTRAYGFVIFLLLVVTHVIDYILIVPLTLSWGIFQLLVAALGFG